MLRPNTRAWCVRVSLRGFSSGNVLLQEATSLSRQADELSTRVRVLATRGHLSEALSLFYASETPHCRQTYATLFHECSRRSFVREGLSLHRHVISNDPTSSHDVFVSNHIVNMYCKFGHLDYARQLFDEMPQRNVVSWTALISGYAQHGLSGDCFGLFSAMLAHCRPNEFAFASVLSSCTEGDDRHGRQVHALATKMGLEACSYVSNALISMYNGTADAWTVFACMQCRNTVTWNSMISMLQYRGLGARAIGLFTQMRREGFGFDRTTLLSILSSIDVNVCFRFCVQLHCLAVKAGFSSEVKVATALIKAYSDLGSDADDCYRVFSEMGHHRDVVSWTSIMTALAERDPERALVLFSELRRAGLTPDWYTFSIALKACAGLVTETHASAVHSQVIKSGFDGDTVLENSLVHAYSRCGSVSMAEQVFDEIKRPDVVSWNSMLKAYALHGRAREVLRLFSRISVQPDSATFVALLSACSHAGLVEEGIEIFDSMSGKYGIVPQIDHYACVVDMYGRAGKIHEAEKLITWMPIEPDSVVWSAFLGSCRKHGETRLAKLAADKLKELEPRSSLGYVQMSNIYCSSGNFNEAGLVWNEMKECRVRKEPGLSWVEINNRVHEFASGGRRHPNGAIIRNKLEELIGQLKQIGYVPETSLALHDIEEEQKEEQLYHHSEKLALVFSIMNEDSLRARGSVVKIIKNIRICMDCHKFMKLASDLLQKEIVVRDSNRFHHFKTGICSCSDYW